MMNRVATFKILNPVLFVLAFCQVITVCIMLLHPSDTVELIHKLIGGTLILVIVLHLISNWNWVKSTYLRKAKK